MAFAALAAVAVMAAACTSASSPSGGGAAAASPPPPPGPAWQAVLDQVRDDGTVTAQTALQAFSLAFGPLPGVSPPPGDPGFMPDGTAALRWLVGYWDEITPEQRRAAIQLVPELQGLQGAGAPAAGTAVKAAGLSAPMDLLAKAPAQRRSNFFYTQFAEEVAADLAAKVGRPLGIPIEARVGLTQKATSGAETGVYNASGGITGSPGKCVIVISPIGDALAGDDVAAIIAHEVWHCFQGAIAGLASYWGVPSRCWVDEGQAEWVGATYAPSAPLNALSWPAYLEEPGYVLFKRCYSALGFYAQLESSGTDVWSKLVPMLQTKGNEAAFSAAGADGDAFLNMWASGFFRMPERGQAWDITGPGVTSDRASVTSLHVPEGGSVKAKAKPYTAAIFGIDAAADVLIFSFSGHARVSDGAGHDYLIPGDVTLCHKDGGCECPGGGSEQPPLSPLEGDGISLAVTGDPGGNSGTVTGMSLDEFCAPLSGTWVGTWQNDNGLAIGGFTLHLTQKGTKLTGTIEVSGKTCVRHGTVTGTVHGSTVEFATHAERDLESQGTVQGNSMSGTWSALACEANVIVTGTWQASKVK